MSSPKGNSKHPQSCVYKDGKSKVIEQSEVQEHLADGWHDNPDETSAVDEEVTEDEAAPESEPEVEPAVNESKGIIGSIKDAISGGSPDETPEEGPTPEPEG